MLQLLYISIINIKKILHQSIVKGSKNSLCLVSTKTKRGIHLRKYYPLARIDAKHMDGRVHDRYISRFHFRSFQFQLW